MLDTALEAKVLANKDESKCLKPLIAVIRLVRYQYEYLIMNPLWSNSSLSDEQSLRPLSHPLVLDGCNLQEEFDEETRSIVDLSIGVAHHGDEEVEEEEEDDHDEEPPVDLADVLVVAVLQRVPARAQLPDGHQEGHDHALGDPLHRVHHAILVVRITKDFSCVLIYDFL